MKNEKDMNKNNKGFKKIINEDYDKIKSLKQSLEKSREKLNILAESMYKEKGSFSELVLREEFKEFNDIAEEIEKVNDKSKKQDNS